MFFISVADPSHFDVDPNPDPGIHPILTWIRILGSTFGNSGSGSSDPPLEIVDPDQSPYFSIIIFSPHP